MKTIAERYIEVKNEARFNLARVFNCTDKMVILALTYRKDSDLAKKIRYTAVSQYGGVPMVHVPECETLHIVSEDGRQLMRQFFNNGAVLEVDKCTGEVTVTTRKGDSAGRWNNVDIPQLGEIQKYAESL